MNEQVWYRKIGQNRGRPRLWLEGPRLERAGLVPGEMVSVEFDDEHQIVRVSAGSGQRKICSRKRRGNEVAVLDIENSALHTVFGEDVGRVRVVGANGQLEISVHPDEAAEDERFERTRKAVRGTRPLKIGSLFHGAGVLDHAIIEGLARAGLDAGLAWALEAEEKYLDASVQNNPAWQHGGRAIEGRIEALDPNDLDPVDILLAGIPCTGASVAGRSKNRLKAAEYHESAGSLFVPTLMAIKTAQPALIVLENVIPYQSTVSMHVLRDVLGTWGYTVHETILKGREMGAIEARDRLAVVAVSRGLTFDPDRIVPTRTGPDQLGELLESIADDDPMWRSYDYLSAKEKKDREAGKGFRMQVLGPEAESVGTIGRSYAKVRSTEVKIAHPSRPGLMRQLTPAEHARVKGIPESLIKGLSATVAHEVLGQSVIFPAFEAVGQAIAECLRQDAPMLAPVTSATPEPQKPVEREQIESGQQQLSLLG